MYIRKDGREAIRYGLHKRKKIHIYSSFRSKCFTDSLLYLP